MDKKDWKEFLKNIGILGGLAFVIEALFIGITGINPSVNGWIYYFFIIIAIILFL